VALKLSELLAELVAIPSVNPMGRPVAEGEPFERALTDFLEQWFTRIGLTVERQTVEPNRDNIVARLEGSVGAPVVLFDAHQDTVPVDGMTIDPFRPLVREGRLFGRGACDIKGGMTAMLGAFARLAAERPKSCPTVLMACTVNEEHGFSGAQKLCELWSMNGGSIFPRRPDFAIVAEPTELDIVVAHKGMVRWRCRTRGRAAHSSLPQLGDNAIFRMAPVLTALERYHRDVLSRSPEHPLCGRATLSVGTIHGGISVNTVPDVCTIEIDRRLLPEDDPARVYRDVIDYLAGKVDRPGSIEHLPPMMESRGLSDAGNSALADRLAVAVREVRGTSQRIGVPFGTNATAYGAHFPTVVFGPGSIAQAHTADEWLALDQLEQASEILYRFLQNLSAA
jgi:acetylornithine deacetylase